ncbi:hypothetical protein BpHYR1_015305 [Brachionus plicatilis]|uniref:Uncharacterized protein n=1 Tax=Brachionus plicatilis TaxID=10195 RepID=A0A3M7RYU2_BRAPC|nr:hypothetical protein BpHYR1_015305 [Brachionus plicatilis]
MLSLAGLDILIMKLRKITVDHHVKSILNKTCHKKRENSSTLKYGKYNAQINLACVILSDVKILFKLALTDPFPYLSWVFRDPLKVTVSLIDKGKSKLWYMSKFPIPTKGCLALGKNCSFSAVIESKMREASNCMEKWP